MRTPTPHPTTHPHRSFEKAGATKLPKPTCLRGGWSWPHSEGTWTTTRTRHTWHLTRDREISFHASDPDSAEETVRTEDDFGRIEFSEFDIDADPGS